MELRDELLHVHAENARLEAVQKQREELLETLVEASIEKARLESQVELMHEREALLTQIASLRVSQEAHCKQDGVQALTIQLEHSRAENASLRAKIAELEETVKAISQKVANQPSAIHVH
jgi:predicted  nucleic acid-binding Zn-ribbon protein